MYTEELIKIIAKKADIDISKFDMKELVMGMSVELEHGSKNEKTDITGDDPDATFKIVLAHMYELPDYYTRLKKMEKKENISEYARRMRELAGLADGNQHKTLKTVQNGESSFEGGATFYAKDMTGIIKENSASPEFYEIEGVIFESNDKEGEFETHKFEQKTIEEGENDQELYNLNENTIIVLDFLNDGDEK